MASNSRTASFAAPSTGGAVTHTLTVSPHSMRFRLDLGVTLTVRSTLGTDHCILNVMLASYVLCLLGPAWSTSWKTTEVGTTLVVHHGKESFAFPQYEPKLLGKMPGGVVVEFRGARRGPSKVIVRRGKRILGQVDTQELKKAWLAVDRYWGPGKEGNNLRYLDGSAGGIFIIVSDAVLTGSRFLTTLSFHAAGPSGEPVTAQVLAWFNPLPKPQFEYIRRLTFLDGYHHLVPPPRLWRRKGELCLIDPGKLVRLDAQGQEKGTIFALPSLPFMKFAGAGRWMVFGPTGYTVDRRIAAVDFQTGKARFLFEGIKPEPYLAFVSESEPVVVASTQDGPAARNFSFNLATGKTTELRMPKSDNPVPPAVWGRWAFVLYGDHLDVVDTATGKLAAQPKVTPEPRA